jgi:hypothetical protein
MPAFSYRAALNRGTDATLDHTTMCVYQPEASLAAWVVAWYY